MGVGLGAIGGAGITGMRFGKTTGGGRNLLDPLAPLQMPVKFEAVVVEVVLGAWNASLAAHVKATTLAAVYQSEFLWVSLQHQCNTSLEEGLRPC